MVKRLQETQSKEFLGATTLAGTAEPKAFKRWRDPLFFKLAMLSALALASLSLYFLLAPGNPSSAQRIAYLESIVKCPSCISVSTKDANTASAFALRSFITQMVHQGASDSEIVSQLTATYGPSILLIPPSGSGGIYLEVAAILLGIGLPVGGFIYYRRRRMAMATIDEDVGVVASAPASESARVTRWRHDTPAKWLHIGSGRLADATGAQKAVAVVGSLLLLGGVGLSIYGISSSASSPSATLSQSEIASRVAAAESLAGTGSDSAALQIFATVLNSDPNQPEALAWNGWLLHLAGKKDASATLTGAGLVQMKRAVALDPRYIYARLFYGIALYQDRDEVLAATRQFRAYLALSPPATLNAQVRTIIDSAYRAAKLTPPL